MLGMEDQKMQGQKNAEAYRQGMRGAVAKINLGRPSRRYPAEERQACYEMGFNEKLEALAEEG